MKYYVGIDGGGTKTLYALFDENKNIISTVKSEGSNHENLEDSFPAAAEILKSGIEKLLSSASLSFCDIEKGLFALAGIDHPFQEKKMTAELKEKGISFPFSVCNDGFIVVKAGITGKAGIGYNCGTGTCCNSVDEDGKLLQIGGLDIYTDDMGGGHWIARQTFIKLYDAVCLGINDTVIASLSLDKFNISADREGVLSLEPGLEENNDEIIRTLIDVFFEALNSGDREAEKIADAMALRGAQYIAGHVNRQNFGKGKIEVVLSGSIHTKLPSEIYINKLIRKSSELTGRQFDFIKLSAMPVTGCINWMLEN